MQFMSLMNQIARFRTTSDLIEASLTLLNIIETYKYVIDLIAAVILLIVTIMKFIYIINCCVKCKAIQSRFCFTQLAFYIRKKVTPKPLKTKYFAILKPYIGKKACNQRECFIRFCILVNFER